MSSEAPKPDYIEKADLGNTEWQERNILKNPTQFNEAELRKAFKDKLDEARGNKLLTSAVLLKKYSEAQKKIDENIARLREVRDYAVQKVKIMEIVGRYKVFNADPSNPVHIVLMQADLDELRDFVKVSRAGMALADKLNMISNESLNVGTLDKKIVEKIDKYYGERFATLNNSEMGRLRGAQAGEASIVDYDTLNFDVHSEREVLGDIRKYTSNPDKYLKMAEGQFAKMKSVLAMSFPKLSKPDQLAMRNLEMAEKDVSARRRNKSAEQWLKDAMALNNMTLAKKTALLIKQDAAEYDASGNLMGKLLEAGDKLFVRANQLSKQSYALAEKAYKEAADKYNFARGMVAAGGKKKTDEGEDEEMLASRK